jgi:hypothetical protein
MKSGFSRRVIPVSINPKTGVYPVFKGFSRGSDRLVPVIPTPYSYIVFSIYQKEEKMDQGILDRAGPFSYHGDPRTSVAPRWSNDQQPDSGGTAK